MFTKKLCEDLDFVYLEIKPEFKQSFLYGRDIKTTWFYDFDEKRMNILKNGVIFIFYFDCLLGIIEYSEPCYKYRCVLKENE